MWILLLGLTGVVSYFLLQKNNKFSYQEKHNNYHDFNNMDYYSFYDENDLEIEKKNLDDNNFNYVFINGLKDKNIQDKLNVEFKSYVEGEKNNGATSVSFNVFLNAFNILSLEIISHYQDENEMRKFYNYDLTSGKEIQFDDLFTKSANVSSILYSGFYNRISTTISGELLSLGKERRATEAFNETGAWAQYYYGRTLEEIDKEIEKLNNDLNNVEDTAFRESREFENKKDKTFYLTNYGIEIPYGKYSTVSLLAKSHLRYFQYYQKYLINGSIFETDDIGNKKLFLSSVNNPILTYSYIKEIDDYAFVDYEFFDIKLPDFVKKYMNKKINQLVDKSDKNKFTYINIDNYYHEPSDSSVGSIDNKFSICTMDKSYFKSTYFKKLFTSKEQETMGPANSYYDDENDKNISCKASFQTFAVDLKKNIYENVDEIFVDGFDYTTFLIDRYYDQYGHRNTTSENYSDDEKRKFSFKLTYGSISIKKEGEDNSYYLDYSSINKSYLKFKY